MIQPRRDRSGADRPPPCLPIAQWPLDERPREKLLREGPSSLTETELLAILLRGGMRNQTAVDVARRLLVRAGSLRRISGLDLHDLERMGLGRVRSATVVAAFELGRRVPECEGPVPDVIRRPEDVVARLGRRLRSRMQEEFWALLLTSSGRVSRQSRITVGTLNASLVHPRECFHLAVKELAASVLFVQNHPSGNPEPSDEDLAVTRQLVQAGSILGIPVLDHVIIAGMQFTSFAERGLLSPEGATRR